MKIFLTGNQGYIGSVMENYLLEKGHEVVGLDAGYFEGRYFVPLEERVILNRKKNQIKKDIRDVGADDMKGFNAIIHLAALSNDPLGYLNPQLTNEINFLSTKRLARIAKKSGISRFIYSSSCSLYGAADVSKSLDESSEFNPVTPYAHSKVNSEKALKSLADENFSPTFMRNATVYGVSPKMRFDLVINKFVGYTYLTGQIKMIGDGKHWRPFVHVIDLCSAFELVLNSEKGKIHNEAFNIGIDEDNYTIKELAEKIVKKFAGSKLVFSNENFVDDSRSYRVNFQKLKNLGFFPKWNVDKGIKELKNCFEKNGLTKEIFGNEYFITLRRIKSLMESGDLDNNLRYLPSKKTTIR